MRGVLLMAAREIRERRILLLAALSLGLLPVIVPRTPWGARLAPAAGAEVGIGMLMIVLSVFSLAMATGLGMSVVPRDIGERRLGFYFARPLPGLAIWGGKMVGSASLMLLALALLVLPSALAGIGSVEKVLEAWGRPLSLPELSAFCVLVFAVANAVSSAFRARSRLLVVDVVALPVVAGALLTVRQQLIDGRAQEAVFGMGLRPVWPLALLLLAASAAQVTIGRADSRRGHIALSSVLWGGLGLGALAYFLFARWVLGATPEDLSYRFVQGPPAGAHFAISGKASGRGGYWPSFLVGASGSWFTRVPARGSSVLWSADGKKAVWIETRASGVPGFASGPLGEVVTAWLGEEVTFTRTPLSKPPLGPLALSADGSRLLVGGEGASVIDVASGRVMCSVPLRGTIRGFFLNRAKIRLFNIQDPRARDVRVIDVDVPSGETTDVGSIRVEGLDPRLRSTPDGARLLVRDSQGLRLLAGDTRPLGVLTTARSFDFGFLSDGRVAVVEAETEAARLRVFGADGKLLTEKMLATEAKRRVWGQLIGGESAPGELVIGLSRPVPGKTRTEWETGFVDATTGAVRHRERGLVPVSRRGFGDLSSAPVPGSLGTRLFWTPARELVWFDPGTGQRRTLIARAPADE